MALEQHVYMSVDTGLSSDDGDVDLPREALMKYRGVAGQHDDPESFCRLMRRRGHLVKVCNEYRGNDLPLFMLVEG